MNRNDIIVASAVTMGMGVLATIKAYRVHKTEEAKREEIRRNTLDEIAAIHVAGARTQKAIQRGEIANMTQALDRLEFETIIAYNEDK